jgi:pimeloyl-ACP methyl ester carboxylesterase
MRAFLCAVALLFAGVAAASPIGNFDLPPKTHYRTADVAGHKIFYREAGDPQRPTIVLLHGYPSSSHTYRELIPMVSRSYHVIAPDYLGSGYSDRPDPQVTPYSFDRLADHVEGLLAKLGLKQYTLYMQDFGAPVGFRLMQRNPQAIDAIIVQNANAYLDGLTPKRREFFRNARDDKSAANVAALFRFTGRDAIVNEQYLRDVPPERHDIMSPDAWTHDLVFLATEKDRKIQLQLFQDYQNNIDRYPVWQSLMKKHQFPALIVWGKNDPAFIAAGAEAYLRDLPKAELHLIDAGHFAVEEQPQLVAGHILRFMAAREQ